MSVLKFENTTDSQKTIQSISNQMMRRISAVPDGPCPVDTLLNYVRLCHSESCGKCVPCRVGLGQIADMLEQVLDGTADEGVLDKIEQTATVINDTADCAIGYEGAQIVLNSIKSFRDDYLEHIRNGNCLVASRHAISCTETCPAHVDVPGYIALVKARRYDDALALIRKDNPFPSVCGYICEHPCESRCRRGMVDDSINICAIKRFAADNAKNPKAPVCAESTGKKVAVIGGGPSGLTVAYFLSLMGHKVTVYEQREKLGGMLRYGIPRYRLPAAVLDKDIEYILSAGVRTVLNTRVTDDVTLDKIYKDYDAVYLSIGAHQDKKLKIEGEDMEGVMSAVQLLRAMEGPADKKPSFKGKSVIVVGGGNVAMDVARTSLRLGASDVKIVYRRRREDMTALKEEVDQADGEGASIMQLLAPVKIEEGKGGKKVLVTQPQIVGPISGGRVSVRDSSAKQVKVEADYIIVAIGQQTDYKKFADSGMETNRGTFKTDACALVAGTENVFAGGDDVLGPATVIKAVAQGKVAADNIDNFLGFDHKISCDIPIPAPDPCVLGSCGRANEEYDNSIKVCKGDFATVHKGLTKEMAEQECSRCLRCDCNGYSSFRNGRVKEW